MDKICKLTYRERSALESVLATSQQAKPFRRAQALLLLDEGEQPEAVAELMRVSRQTIHNWGARFNKWSELSVAERLFDAPRSGRPAIANGIIDDLLDEIVETDPRQWGYHSTVWTAKLLQDYLADCYQMTVRRRSVRYALDRIRVAWKRPRHTLALQELNWRQVKGGSSTACGHRRERWF